MTLYTHQESNTYKTWLIMGLFFVLVICVGWTISYIWNEPGILYIAVFLSIFMNILSYWYSDRIVIKMTGARPADSIVDLELIRIVENIAITAGLPMPKVYIINDPAPNALATGRDKDHALIAVTTGLLEILEKSEIEGVIAHEFAHIGNRDILLSTVMVVLAGFVSIISDIFLRSMGRRNGGGKGGGALVIVGIIVLILAPIAASLLRLAVSRKREFLADATGALITRYPEGLARALEKISQSGWSMARKSDSTAHLFFVNPFGRPEQKAYTAFHRLFLTHPPVEERIKALREQ